MTNLPESDERSFAAGFRRAYERTPLSAEVRQRVLATVRAQPRPRRSPWPTLAWALEPRVTLPPAVAAAAAVALVVAGVVLGLGLERARTRTVAPLAMPATAAEVRFVFVDRAAARVALVGDFNGWDAAALPLARESATGAWTITVRLAPGVHAYAFLVNGDRWVADPRAPLAPADDFGTPRSVVVVGEHGV